MAAIITGGGRPNPPFIFFEIKIVSLSLKLSFISVQFFSLTIFVIHVIKNLLKTVL